MPSDNGIRELCTATSQLAVTTGLSVSTIFRANQLKPNRDIKYTNLAGRDGKVKGRWVDLTFSTSIRKISRNFPRFCVVTRYLRSTHRQYGLCFTIKIMISHLWRCLSLVFMTTKYGGENKFNKILILADVSKRRNKLFTARHPYERVTKFGQGVLEIRVTLTASLFMIL